MATQSNFPHDPIFWQGSPEKNLPGNATFQAIGGSAMNRDLSNQSSNTTGTSTSEWTDYTGVSTTTASSFSTQNWDPINDLDNIPGIKFEDMYDYQSSMEYSTEDHCGGPGVSPVTEQANSFGDLTLSSYHAGSDQLSSGSRQLHASSTVPRHYPQAFERYPTPEHSGPFVMNNYQTQGSQSMARTNSYGSTLDVYRPSSVPSNGHSSYSSSQSGEGPTPTSLGWVPGTDHVKKYKLVLVTKNNLYLDILDESDITWETPSRVYLENVPSSSKGEAHCPWPGKCERREPFGRQADLERHLKNVHGSPDSYPCPHNPCLNNRHVVENAFTRKDHLRDHLRDFHQEDIGSAKGEKNARSTADKKKWAKEQEKWVASRKISASHWRCAKCLVKKSVAKHGWHCGECNQPCEPERVDRRRRLAPTPSGEAQFDMDGVGGVVRGDSQLQQQVYSQYPATTCRACYGNEWVDDGYGKWEPCPSCNYHDTEVGAQTFR